MKASSKIKTTIIFLVIFLFRCGSTSIGNPTAVSLGIVGTNQSSFENIEFRRKLLVSNIELSEVRVVLSELEFRPFEFCQGNEDDDGEIEFEGPYVVDLLNNQSIPNLNETQLNAGKYCKIELRLEKLEGERIPTGISVSDEIVGNSVRIVGKRADDTPFTVELEFDDEFELENEISGFEIGEGGALAFFIGFNLGLWFEGVDLDLATSSMGTITIDKDNNEGLAETIRENIKNSADLFEDQNEDGELDEDEDDEDDSLAS